MKRIIKNKILICIISAAFALLAAVFGSAYQAYAYKTEQLSEVDEVINLDDATSAKFTEKGLKQLAVAAGYADLNDMMSSATAEGTSITASFTDKVVRLGRDTTEGGAELKWVPVYLSRSEEDKNGDGTKDAVLTLWLANDVYSSAWSDGTYSTSATKSFNGNTIYSNTYDGSFIRHNLNGKGGWTENWGDGNNQRFANDNIRTLVENFYGSGTFAGYVTTPANVSWQANANYMKNDPNWEGNVTLTANYPCDWLNDNVWLPSIYEVCDSTVSANSTASSFTSNGGLWRVNEGNICSVKGYSRLRSGVASSAHRVYLLSSAGGFGSGTTSGSEVVRPAIHINLESALAAADPNHEHVWQSAENEGWVINTHATCTDKGEEQRVCTVSGCDLPDSTQTREIEIDPALHTFGTTWSSDETNHWHAATCGHTTETKDLAAHSWNDGGITTPASCKAEGEKTYTCTVCNATKTESILKEEHNWGEWTNNNNATTHIRSCQNAVCSETQTQAHTFPDEWETDSEATEDAEGSKHRDCTVCGYRQTETIPQLDHEHKFAEGWTSDDNYHWHASTCGHNVKDGEEEHSWNGGEVTTLASCTEGGERTYTCTVCGKTRTESISANGHTEVTDEAVEPTCTETGLTEGKHCPVCEEVLAEQEEIPANGHFYDWKVTLMPTEETEGLKEELCTICGHKNDEEVIAKLVVDDNGNVADLPTGHDYDLDIEVRETKESYDGLDGVNKGYVVKLWVVDGEEKTPYDSLKLVTLRLVLPEGMQADNFKLYKRLLGGDYDLVENYEVEGRIVTIRTTLSAEFVFNAPAPEEPKTGIPWWVWLIVAVGGVAIMAVVIVLIKKKKGGNGGGDGSVIVTSDNGEVIGRLDKQDEKLAEIKEIVDGGFNDFVDND